jgi:hypothetical protein
MSRIKLLLAIPFLAAVVPSLHAQGYVQRNEFVSQDAFISTYTDPSHPSVWIADRTPSPKFPVLVLLQKNNTSSAPYASYSGKGLAHFYAPVGQTISFSYDCHVVLFLYGPTEFHARWVKDGTRLQILLAKPGTDSTKTCTIKTSQPVLQASAKPPAKP